jgi:formylglycine-generating enzyme required for sulfatase activity
MLQYCHQWGVSKMNAMIRTLLFALGCSAIGTASRAETGPSYQLSNGKIVSTLEMFQECADCPEMIVMPLGSFMMGAISGESRNPFDLYGENATGTKREPGEINIIPSEHPRHPVEIDIPFAMGRNEITHTEWMACVDDGGCAHNPVHQVLTFPNGYVALGPNHPMVNVSFLDAQEYVAWLNAKLGTDVYRLPTEAEWEYAARAGTTTRFAQGDDLTSEQANFSGKATENVRGHLMPELVTRGMPVEVDMLDAANAWGLRHMSGNVAEVTLSCYSAAHLGLPKTSSYLHHAMSEGTCRRVAKGGRYGSAMNAARLAERSRPEQDRRRDFFGFRIIRTF